MRAMIVAAGLGTRLRPLTNLLPKPALPVRGVPLIGYTLALLAHHSVREVIINVHHLPDRLVEAAKRCCPPGLSIEFSVEPRLLDTGGAIRRVADFLRESDPALLIGGDMLLDTDLTALVAAHHARDSAFTMLLRSGDSRVSGFGSIGVDDEGCLRRIGQRFDLGGETRSGIYTWANVVSARALDTLPDRDAFNHLDDWIAPLLRAGRRDIRAELVSADRCVWEPVGTMSEYLEANLRLPRLSYRDQVGGSVTPAHVEGDLVIGAGAVVGAGARLRRAVVWEREVVPDALCAQDGVFAGGSFHACTERDSLSHPGGAA